jgi:hypothetical protein
MVYGSVNRALRRGGARRGAVGVPGELVREVVYLERVVRQEINCRRCGRHFMHEEVIPPFSVPEGLPPSLHCAECGGQLRVSR